MSGGCCSFELVSRSRRTRAYEDDAWRRITDFAIRLLVPDKCYGMGCAISIMKPVSPMVLNIIGSDAYRTGPGLYYMNTYDTYDYPVGFCSARYLAPCVVHRLVYRALASVVYLASLTVILKVGCRGGYRAPRKQGASYIVSHQCSYRNIALLVVRAHHFVSAPHTVLLQS